MIYLNKRKGGPKPRITFPISYILNSLSLYIPLGSQLLTLSFAISQVAV